MVGKDHQKWWISVLQTQCHSKNYQLLFICYHPNLYKKNILHFRTIIYRFHVFQTSGNPSLSIFTLLEPYDASSPPYIEFKWNLHWWEAKHLTIWRKKISLINYAQKDLTVKNINTFSPLKTNGRKNDYESQIHWLINSTYNWRRIFW